ncbi:MAG: type I-F CRISPR-associated protein Csy2 [Pseudomonadales bacterium]|nr:type I-F CRISPR-associated protein Csy2 [Pseudomonadales bacterium]
MSCYITLNRIEIQNANCVAGLTFGFPAVTHFLGYVHALSLKLNQSQNLTLDGCAIVCHQHQIHAYQPKGFGEYTFALTRNPLTKGGKTAPIIEEGKMHLTVSLVIKCNGLIEGGEEGIKHLQKILEQICYSQKMAGGVICDIKNITIESSNSEIEQDKITKIIRRRLLPGFVLLDRSEYLRAHLLALQTDNPDTEMIDAWLDFSALRFKAEVPEEKSDGASDNANWKTIPKPESGYLVPITTGYKAISNVIPPGEIKGARDPSIPFCFVEAAYGIGEWQSPHRLQNIDNALWHYHQEKDWYLCVNKTSVDNQSSIHEEDNFDFID